MKTLIKIPIVLEPQEEGGWLVRSPLIPELITEIDDLRNLEAVVQDAFEAVKELYEDMGKTLPVVEIKDLDRPFWLETVVVTK